MHRINTNSAPIVFPDKLTKLSHLYLNKFFHKLNRCKYRISVRGPHMWNEYLTKKEKKLTSNFELAVKSKLLLSNNELSYF